MWRWFFLNLYRAGSYCTYRRPTTTTSVDRWPPPPMPVQRQPFADEWRKIRAGLVHVSTRGQVSGLTGWPECDACWQEDDIRKTAHSPEGGGQHTTRKSTDINEMGPRRSTVWRFHCITTSLFLFTIDCPFPRVPHLSSHHRSTRGEHESRSSTRFRLAMCFHFPRKCNSDADCLVHSAPRDFCMALSSFNCTQPHIAANLTSTSTSLRWVFPSNPQTAMQRGPHVLLMNGLVLASCVYVETNPRQGADLFPILQVAPAITQVFPKYHCNTTSYHFR